MNHASSDSESHASAVTMAPGVSGECSSAAVAALRRGNAGAVGRAFLGSGDDFAANPQQMKLDRASGRERLGRCRPRSGDAAMAALAAALCMALGATASAQNMHTGCPDYDLTSSTSSLTGPPPCGQDTAGNPINLHTLNLHRAVLDLEADANGQLRLDLVRTHNSRFDLRHIWDSTQSHYMLQSNSMAVFGPTGWTHSFNYHLYYVYQIPTTGNTHAMVFEGDGQAHIFHQNLLDGGTAYNKLLQVARSATRDTLERVSDPSHTDNPANPAGFILHKENGWQIHFFEDLSPPVNPGYPRHFVASEIHDPAGNVLELAYNGDRLHSVTDSSGRSLTFGYNEENLRVFVPPPNVQVEVSDASQSELEDLEVEYGENGPNGPGGALVPPVPSLLTSVTDSSGRKVRYEYEQRGTTPLHFVQPLYLSRVTIEDENATGPGDRIEVSRYTYAQPTDANRIFFDNRISSAEDRNGPKDYPVVKYGYPEWIDGVERSTADVPTNSLFWGAISREQNLDKEALIVEVEWPASQQINDDWFEYRDVTRPSSDQPDPNQLTTVTRRTTYEKAVVSGPFPIGLPNNDLPLQRQDFMGEFALTTYATYTMGLGLSTRQPTVITNRLGEVTGLEYDISDGVGPAKSPVSKKVHADGSTELWTYYPHAVTGVPRWLVNQHTDRLGRVTTHEYQGATNLLVEKTYPDTTTELWTYSNSTTHQDNDTVGLLLSYTDRNGAVTEYEYAFNSADGWLQEVAEIDAVGRETYTEFDVLGRVVKETAPGGRVTTYAYNVHGDVVTQTLPDGSVIESEYDTLVGSTFNADYDSYYLDQTVHVDGPLVNKKYFKNRGNRTRETIRHPSNQNEPEVVREYVYDAYNRLIAERLIQTADPLDFEETTFSYMVSSEELPPAGGHCCGGRTLVRSKTDAEGRVTQYFYDEEDRLKIIWHPHPTNPAATTPYSADYFYYDAEGRLISVHQSLSRTVDYYYDAMGRQFFEWTSNSGSRPGQLRITRHDLQGRIVLTADYPTPPSEQDRDDYIADHQAYVLASGGANPPSPPTLPDDGRITIYDYDLDGNPQTTGDDLNDWPIRVRRVMGSTPSSADLITTYFYDDMGNVVAVLDPRGNVTETDYDDIYRVVEVRFPATVLNGPNAVQAWVYDLDDDLTIFINEEGEEAETHFDIRGRVSKVVNGAGDEMTYAYDIRGNVLSVSDYPDGQTPRTTTNQYDAADRRIRTEEPGGKVMTVAYDKVGNMVEMADYPGGEQADPRVTTYEHDRLDRMVKVTHPKEDPNDSNEVATFDEYTYNTAGWVTKITDRDSKETAYTYDRLGRRLTAKDGNNNTTTSEYDGVGQLVRLIDATDAETAYAYDFAGRL